MRRCAVCGKEIERYHAVFAFVTGAEERDAEELCMKHSYEFAYFLEMHRMMSESGRE